MSELNRWCVSPTECVTADPGIKYRASSKLVEWCKRGIYSSPFPAQLVRHAHPRIKYGASYER